MPVPNGEQFHSIVSRRHNPSYTEIDLSDLIYEAYRGAGNEQAYFYKPQDNKVNAALVTKYSEGDMYTHRPKKYGQEWADSAADRETGQVPLFTHSGSPRGTHVQLLEGTEGARVPAMVLLGIAEDDAQRRYGRGLIPSRDLSKHSHRLVQHLEEKGVTKMPSKVKRNPMTYLPEPTSQADYVYGPSTPIDAERVQRGRATLRGALRKPKENTQEPPEQLRMDI
jgi:hypothetical protein